jgi:hypothetical protein
VEKHRSSHILCGFFHIELQKAHENRLSRCSIMSDIVFMLDLCPNLEAAPARGIIIQEIAS